MRWGDNKTIGYEQLANDKAREMAQEEIDDTILDFGLIDFDDDDLDAGLELSDFEFETRYSEPKNMAHIKQKHVKYSNAQKLAGDIRIADGVRVNVIVNGKFEFGDFIEAFVMQNNAKVVEMTISTLSYSQNNIDSLANLIHAGRLCKLNLIVSHYFHAHNKGALNYAYQELDIEGCDFQLAVAEIHTKSCIFETLGGKKIAIHGSANLRSSGSIEHFTIEENAEMHDFHNSFYQEIIEHFATINKEEPRVKALRGKIINNLIQ